MNTHNLSPCCMLWYWSVLQRLVAVCYRKCILKGWSQRHSSLMWSVWESWSLRSSQTTVRSSSGLKLKVCLFCPVIYLYGCTYRKNTIYYCLWYAFCLCLTHTQMCMYLHIDSNRLFHACFNAFICTHVWFCICCFIAPTSSWEKGMGDCTAGLHWGAP